MIAYSRLATCAAIIAAGMMWSAARADDPPPEQQPQKQAEADKSARDDAPGNQPGERDRARAAIRQGLERQLSLAKERELRLQRLLKLLDSGKTIAEIRSELRELGVGPMGGPGPGPGGGRDFLDRDEQGGPGAGGPADVGRGGPRAGRPDGPEGRDAPRNRGGGPPSPEQFISLIEQLDRPLPGWELARVPEAGPRPGQAPPGEYDENSDASPAATADRESFVNDFLSASAPDVLERFRELRKRDPEEASRKIGQIFPRVRHLFELRQRDPEMFALRMRDIRFGRESLEASRGIARLDGKGAAADDPERTKLLDRLHTSLGELYNVRTEILTKELARMRSHLDDAARQIELRPEARQKAVDRFSKSMIERERDRMQRRDADSSADRNEDGPPLEGPGLDRPGMDRPGMDRPGMDRPGMDRPGDGPGPDHRDRRPRDRGPRGPENPPRREP